MSFLWRGNSQTETPTCKDCIDKDKRMSDYELFFNEMKDVLKKKEDQLHDLQLKFDDVSKKLEEQDVIVQAQTIFREKLIEEYEFSKKVNQEEKRQWIENNCIWRETKRQLDSSIFSLEGEKSNLEEQISQLLEDKVIWRKHQKILEDKIQTLTANLKESEEKYEDLKKHMKVLEVRNIEMELKQEEIKSIYQEKLEHLNDEQQKKEEEWKTKEEEYEFLIQRYQDNEIDYEMKIQDMKYVLSCEIDELEKKYKEKIEEKDNEWENRIQNLNAVYDNEFVQYKEHFKNKEQKLEREKETIEQTLRLDIEQLRRENMELEEAKRQMEKKRMDHQIKWENRESALISQVELLSLDNQRLEKEEKNTQKKMEKEQNALMKQIEIKTEEARNYKMELEKNQKILEETILNVIEKNKINKETQTITDEVVSMGVDSYEVARYTDEGLRQRKKKKLKRKQIYSENSKCDSAESFVEWEPEKNYTMTPNQKKTTQGHHNLTMSNISEEGNQQQEQNQTEDHHIIDIPCNDYEEDPGNFFLRLTGFINTPHADKQDKKIKSLEDEIKTLRAQNTEYLTKIQSYECKSILDLNRKIRSGTPVRFFPYHTNNTVSNPSHIHSIDIDLH
jgi:hypothetical protein